MPQNLHRKVEKLSWLFAPLKASSVPDIDGAIQSECKYSKSLLKAMLRTKTVSVRASSFQYQIPESELKKQIKIESSAHLSKQMSCTIKHAPERDSVCHYLKNWLNFTEEKYGSRVKAGIKAVRFASLFLSTPIDRWRRFSDDSPY